MVILQLKTYFFSYNEPNGHNLKIIFYDGFDGHDGIVCAEDILWRGICCNKVRLRCGSGEPLELEVDERLHVGGDELVGEQDGCGCGEDNQWQRHGGIRCDRVAERGTRSPTTSSHFGELTSLR